ncbi:hypothetical protein Pmani_025552 [Petrolisthes manimaculis]|uniref:Uncharacterized protein n=1 Tax=Petrolisthes manimaculis TaxID=1843537 RepID=A0AAE1P7Q2_9EUCA|nr:hypothetical protein Pmani_025552 [Petrolisthes manimaculis]
MSIMNKWEADSDERMAMYTSPSTLQVLSTAAGSTLLLEWAGLTGRVTTGTAASRSTNTRQGSVSCCHPRSIDGTNKTPFNSRVKDNNINRESNAYVDQRVNNQKLTHSSRLEKSLLVHEDQRKRLSRKRYTLSYTGLETKAKQEEITVPSISCNSRVNCIENALHTTRDQTLELPGCLLNNFPNSMNAKCMRLNTEKCALYLQSHLPPLLLECVLDSAWVKVRQLVEGQGQNIPRYQVVNWARTAPVIISVDALLSNKKYSLDVSGVSQADLQDTLSVITLNFPLKRINKLQLPKRTAYESAPSIKPLTKIVRIDLGCARVGEIREMNVSCPVVEEISLIADLHMEEILPTLTLYQHITHLDISYFPSSPTSLPKQDGRLLLPLMSHFNHQLQSVSLTGFNLQEGVMASLSQLPELRTLQLADSWLSSPTIILDQPFRSLENLSLKLLPSNSLMQLLTAGSCLVNVTFEFVASELEGNALTDSLVSQLVTSGRISSVQSFTARSPYLTLVSLTTLCLLPNLRSIGSLALWGLTEDELRCVTHSSPSHILYIQ